MSTVYRAMEGSATSELPDLELHMSILAKRTTYYCSKKATQNCFIVAT